MQLIVRLEKCGLLQKNLLNRMDSLYQNRHSQVNIDHFYIDTLEWHRTAYSNQVPHVMTFY